MLPSTSLRDQLSVEKTTKATKSERKVPKVVAKAEVVKSANNSNLESNSPSIDPDRIPRIFNIGVKP